MKRVFIIHRWAGGPEDDWRPWLKSQLEAEGFEVIVPAMPDTEEPVIEKWVNHLAHLVGKADEETFFIGHSIGCQTILRYLETIDTPVSGAVFVSGWFKLENLEDEETEAIAKPWMTETIDLEKVKQVLPKSSLIISDNDPFACFEYNKEQFSKIGSTVIVLSGAGHITEDDGFTEAPVVLEAFNNLQKSL